MSSHFKTQGAVVSLATYNDTGREHIGGFVYATLGMRFWTTPNSVAYLFIEDVIFRRHTCSIFNISKLNLHNFNSLVVLLSFD